MEKSRRGGCAREEQPARHAAEQLHQRARLVAVLAHGGRGEDMGLVEDGAAPLPAKQVGELVRLVRQLGRDDHELRAGARSFERVVLIVCAKRRLGC